MRYRQTARVTASHDMSWHVPDGTRVIRTNSQQVQGTTPLDLTREHVVYRGCVFILPALWRFDSTGRRNPARARQIDPLRDADAVALVRLTEVVILQIRMRTECVLPGQVELESSVEAESESVVVQAVDSGASGGE